MGCVYLVLEIDRTLQEDQIFNLVHSKYKEGCQDEGLANIIQTNPFFE